MGSLFRRVAWPLLGAAHLLLNLVFSLKELMDAILGIQRSPRAILLANGQRHSIGAVVREIGDRVLICTDERFAASAEMQEIVVSLKKASVQYAVFDQTQPELPIDGVHACVEAWKSFDPNVVVGLGGGSCMDMAKLVSLLLTHGGPLSQYYGEFKVPGPILPVVAVSTTSGTGSEVTPVAVLADNGRDLKVGISSPYLIPHTAICDPELTATCPPMLTALSGADALTHAIEAFTAIRRPVTPTLGQERVFVGKNVFSDHHALSAIRTIGVYLPRAVRDGKDMEARGAMMAAAVQAGLAFGVAGTAAAHAIQYPVGASTHTAHGIGVAVLLPYVMAWNAREIQHELSQIALALGAAPSDEKQLAAEAIQRVRALFSTIGIPTTLKDLGVEEARLDWISEQSMLSARLVNNNPRELRQDGVREIVENAWNGSI